MITWPIIATLKVTAVLEALDIPYSVSGSLASALHLVPCATLAVDIVAALQDEHVRPMAVRLSDGFYLDEASIREAVQQGTSSNLIRLASMYKVDVFGSTGRPFEQAEFARRVCQTLSDEPFHVVSPEDIALAKLEGYQRGQGISDHQWRDVLAVIKIKRASLDWGYLSTWATQLGISDLLNAPQGRRTGQE